jgi:hypothetical protein
MNQQNFELEYSLFSILGGLYNGKKSALSPLGSAEFKPLSPDISDKLRACNILDAQGQLLAGFAPALEILGSAEAYARLRFIGAARFIDYAVYFCQEQCVSLSAAPKGLLIHLPTEVEAMLNDLKLYLGESSAQNSSFDAHLSVDEAVVLAALIDLRRGASLRALSDHAPLTPAPFEPSIITRTISSGLDQAQWLSGMLRTLCGVQNPLPSSQVQVALSNLAAKGLLVQTERSFGLNEVPTFLADRLLVINNVIWLEAAHANSQDRVAFANLVCCQAGLNDLLCMQFDGLEVSLHASAPAALLEKIQRHLSDANLLPAPPLVQTTYKLSVMSGPAAGQSYPLKALTTLGREADCDIQVKDIKVSRKHAQIDKLETGYQLSDLKSTNGTFVNGIAITAPLLLKENDIITLGETRLALVSVPDTSTPIVSDATMYAAGGDLPLAGIQIPAAEPGSPRGGGKTGPFVEPIPEPVLPPEPFLAPEPLLVTPEAVFQEPEAVFQEPEAVFQEPEPVFQEPEPELIPPAPELFIAPPSEVTITPPPEVVITPPIEAEMIPPAPEAIFAPPQQTVIPSAPANICPTCGNTVLPGARFCGSCGQVM